MVVKVCITVGVGTVGEIASVGEGIGDAVGVITIGLPNSRQPRSGAVPINPVSGLAGMSSPLAAMYCVTPLSIAGEDDCRSKQIGRASCREKKEYVERRRSVMRRRKREVE